MMPPRRRKGLVLTDAENLLIKALISLTELVEERDAYRATLMDIAAVKHPDAVRTPHQEMAAGVVRKWETGK